MQQQMTIPAVSLSQSAVYKAALIAVRQPLWLIEYEVKVLPISSTERMQRKRDRGTPEPTDSREI